MRSLQTSLQYGMSWMTDQLSWNTYWLMAMTIMYLIRVLIWSVIMSVTLKLYWWRRRYPVIWLLLNVPSMNTWYVYTVVEIIYVCTYVCIYLHTCICQTLRTMVLYAHICIFVIMYLYMHVRLPYVYNIWRALCVCIEYHYVLSQVFW